MDRYSNSSEFKGKLEIGNNSAAEFDTKFINIAELFTKSDSTQKLFSIELGCRIITNFEFPFKS